MSQPNRATRHGRRMGTAHRLPGLVLVAVFVFRLDVFAAAASGGNSASPFYQYGPLEIRPHLAYNGSYNERLLLRPGVAKGSYVETFSPGLLVNFGPRWSLDYTPSYTIYSQPEFRDRLTHSVNGNGGVAYRDTSLSFDQGYRYAADPLIETGRQTETETVSTNVSATHALSPRLLLQGDAQQTLTFVSSAPDFYQWSASGNVRYQFSQTLTAGGHIGSGYSAIYKAPDMIYTQPGLDLSWTPSAKLAIAGAVSLDNRIILARRWQWLQNPVFTASASYAPFDVTSLQGNLSRIISPSFFRGQASTITLYGFSVQQRLLGHLWLNGGITYQNSEYITAGRVAEFARKDNAWSYTAGVRTTFFKRGKIGVSYQDSDSHSNLPGFNLQSWRVAWDISYRY
jgi:hypothetical protein